MSARNRPAAKALRRQDRAWRRLVNLDLRRPLMKISVCGYCGRAGDILTLVRLCPRCVVLASRALSGRP